MDTWNEFTEPAPDHWQREGCHSQRGGCLKIIFHEMGMALISTQYWLLGYFLFVGLQVFAMQVGCAQKMSQVDQDPVWATDSK